MIMEFYRKEQRIIESEGTSGRALKNKLSEPLLDAETS